METLDLNPFPPVSPDLLTVNSSLLLVFLSIETGFLESTHQKVHNSSTIKFEDGQ